MNNSNKEINTNQTNNIDEELIKSFIGPNYDKITTKPFNFAGFFFLSFYMFYRKMFLYGIIFFIINFIVINIINNLAINLLFSLASGFFINKVYIYYANQKITKIKLENPDKDIEELKNICSNQGNPSIKSIFLGLFSELVLALILSILMMFLGINVYIKDIFNFNNSNILENDNNSSTEPTLLENIVIKSHMCYDTKCIFNIETSNNKTGNFEFDSPDIEILKIIEKYSDYIKVNLYYYTKNNKKIISSYKIYLRLSGEDISDIKSEDELREKIGLYKTGTYTETFTLIKIGTRGIGFKDNTPYTYISYTFANNYNIEYKMDYINPKDINLVEGNTYTVTFEVSKGIFNYDFHITSIT